MATLSIERLEDRTVPTVILNTSVPIDLNVVIPKTGDTVHITGSLHIVMEETIDSAGNMHLKEHFQPQGVSGIDLTTGAKYRGTGVTQDQEKIVAPGGNGATVTTFVDNFNIIGQGPDNNFTIHENSQITINANGDVTANFDKLTIDQGSGG